MHKNLVFWLVMGAVFVLGMIFQATINRGGVVSADLEGSHAQLLSQNGVSSSNYDHLFVAVKSDSKSESSDSLTLDHIKGDLWGIKSSNVGTSIGIAQFTATIQNKSVVLKGQLDSQETIKSIESAVHLNRGLN